MKTFLDHKYFLSRELVQHLMGCSKEQEKSGYFFVYFWLYGKSSFDLLP